MNSVVHGIVWYFAPALQVARGTNALSAVPPARLWRFLLVHTLPPILVLAGFVWILAISNWGAAAILGAVVVGLGAMHWLFGNWLMARLGGTS